MVCKEELNFLLGVFIHVENTWIVLIFIKKFGTSLHFPWYKWKKHLPVFFNVLVGTVRVDQGVNTKGDEAQDGYLCSCPE